MIARLTTSKGTATLTAGGKWVSENARFQRYLNLTFPPELYPASPAEPRPRNGQAAAAARELRGKLVWLKAGTPQPAGTVN